jgi:tetratricopeptide (TPR) repeat protein
MWMVMGVLAAATAFGETNYSPNLVFDQAHSAYVAGNYAEARRGYLDLIDHGYATMETWYNLANVTFHDGRLGEAIVYYRRAWMLNPRDADVMANLQLAVQRTGAAMPELRAIDRIAQEMNISEWRFLMLTGYWLVIASVALGLGLPALRRVTRPLALLGGLAGLIGLGGWLYWLTWIKQTEAVITQGDQTALYEPRPNATAYFALPEGSLVRIEDTFDSWLKVRSGDRSGWIMKTAAERVYPWHDAEIK